MRIRDRIKELRRVPASDLRPSPRNWRTHPAAQLDALRAVLAEVGFAGAELARELPDGSLELIDGHARAEIAGDSPVPVLVLDVDEAEAAKILATFDPLGAMAEANAAKLDELLRGVETPNEALAGMLANLAKDAGCEWAQDKKEIVEDDVPEPPVEPVTKPGDLWILGRHRLLCGDSTKREDVERLMGGERADVAVVDPPFDAPDSVWVHWIMDPCVVFGQARHVRKIPDALWRFERIVVKKYRHRCATTQVDHRHAFVVQVGSVRTCPHSSATFPSVIEQESEREHHHAKPVALLEEHLTQWVAPWSIVVDPFAGSGTTFIVAERLGRKCRGIEKDPACCDVIAQRWERVTGNKASRQATDKRRKSR